MFVGKARSLPQRTTPEKRFHLSRLQPYSQKFRLEKIARDKHSSLLQIFVNYGRKKLLTLGPERRRGRRKVFKRKLTKIFLCRFPELKLTNFFQILIRNQTHSKAEAFRHLGPML
jgi:hypothetical protein